MPGRLLLPLIVLALSTVTAPAVPPTRLSPILPEVSKHLAEGHADVSSNTMPMAKAHAELVLLGQDIKLSVLFQGVPAKQQAACLKTLDSATAQWEQVLDDGVHFVRVGKGEASNVTVRFRPSVMMKNEPVAGYVNWKRAIKTAPDGTVASDFTADLQIRVKNLDGAPMPENAMRHAAMHELGHVLGLDDSPREGDVMGPLDVENPVSCPTPLEAQTVKALRSEASEILEQASPSTVAKS